MPLRLPFWTSLNPSGLTVSVYFSPFTSSSRLKALVSFVVMVSRLCAWARQLVPVRGPALEAKDSVGGAFRRMPVSRNRLAAGAGLARRGRLRDFLADTRDRKSVG